MSAVIDIAATRCYSRLRRQQRTVKISDTDIGRIRTVIEELVEELHLPGIAVGVVSGDRLAYAQGFGYADIESRRPQDPALRQRIGSITKTMTGLCAVALVDEGRLSLDDRVVERLPDVTFHGPADALTVRHLLTHTGGIGVAPTVEDLLRLGEIQGSDVPDFPGIPQAYPKGITIEVPPGTKWCYANDGFALLGEIIARAEGAPIEEVLRRRIFHPLAMGNSDCLDRPHPDLSTGYHRPPTDDERELAQRANVEIPEQETVDGHNIRGRYQYITMPAAGAVQSTIPDMARYASALLRRGGGLVRPETFDAMVAPQWCPDPRLSSMGRAFFYDRAFGRRTFGHAGAAPGGWTGLLSVFPDDDLAVLVHVNLWLAEYLPVSWRILRAVMDAPTPPLPQAPLDPIVLRTAPGVYEAPQPGWLTNFQVITGTGRIQITAEEGDLILRARRGPWKDGVRMRPADASDPAFFTLDAEDFGPPHLAFILDQSGAVRGFRADGLLEMVRNDELKPWA